MTVLTGGNKAFVQEVCKLRDVYMLIFACLLA